MLRSHHPHHPPPARASLLDTLATLWLVGSPMIALVGFPCHRLDTPRYGATPAPPRPLFARSFTMWHGHESLAPPPKGEFTESLQCAPLFLTTLLPAANHCQLLQPALSSSPPTPTVPQSRPPVKPRVGAREGLPGRPNRPADSRAKRRKGHSGVVGASPTAAVGSSRPWWVAASCQTL